MIVVGITKTARPLAEYPETREGYQRAVTLIDHLIDHEEGIYYLDAPDPDTLDREGAIRPDGFWAIDLPNPSDPEAEWVCVGYADTREGAVEAAEAYGAVDGKLDLISKVEDPEDTEAFDASSIEADPKAAQRRDL